MKKNYMLFCCYIICASENGNGTVSDSRKPVVLSIFSTNGKKIENIKRKKGTENKSFPFMNDLTLYICYKKSPHILYITYPHTSTNSAEIKGENQLQLYSSAYPLLFEFLLLV